MRKAWYLLVGVLCVVLSFGLPIFGLNALFKPLSLPWWIPVLLGIGLGSTFALFGVVITHGFYTRFRTTEKLATGYGDSGNTGDASSAVAAVVCTLI